MCELASARLEAGDRRGAAAAIREASGLAGTDGPAWLRISALHEEAGDVPAALEAAARAARVMAREAAAHATVCRLAEAAGDLATAASAAAIAVWLEPDDGPARLRLASVLLRQRRWAEARRELSTLLVRSEGADALAMLADAEEGRAITAAPSSRSSARSSWLRSGSISVAASRRPWSPMAGRGLPFPISSRWCSRRLRRRATDSSARRCWTPGGRRRWRRSVRRRADPR
ncbi:MAG: hypothetical protein R3F43_27995 [bacterium]